MPDILHGQNVTNYLFAHRVLLYTLSSTIAVSATVFNALQDHSNFYSAAVYLSKSSRSVLVLVNFALLIALSFARLIQQVFFGDLRPLEIERLYDRMWFFVTESLLAFTIFRDEFDIPFGVMFLFLLFVKSFHWLMADRVEWMNQMPYPGPSTLFHIRMQALFAVLYLTDAIMILFAVENVLSNGVGAIVLFASEYAILSSNALNSMAKYLLCTYEMRRAASRGGENAPPWENKSMYVFYIDLATDFAKLVTYLTFFAVVITFYGVPLNVIRDVYVTARSFVTRLLDLMRYRAATKNMDTRYPNASEEEMSAMSDRTCIICREEMIARGAASNESAAPPAEDGPNMTPKKLPCGHIFHFHCLRSWLERQQSCPTCRRGVLDNPPTTAQAAGGPDNAHAQAPGNNAVPPRADPQQRGAFGQQPNLIRALLGLPPAQQPQQAAAVREPPRAPPFNGGAPPHPPQPLQQLQPPPVWHGFQGPGGVWQPWPGDAQRAAPDANSMQATTPGSVTNESGSSPQPSASLSASTPEGSTEGANASASPREAAAAAAMRRFGGSRSNSTGAPPAPSSSNLTRRPDPSQASSSNPPHSQSADLPALIPMYDVASRSPSLHYLPSTPSGSLISLGSSHPQAHLNHRPQPRFAGLRQPLTSLPPSLSQEELSRLDSLTRDAIDERLRVLENVSVAMHRSMEELTRMRSVLPSLPSPSPSGALSSSKSVSGIGSVDGVSSAVADTAAPVSTSAAVDLPSGARDDSTGSSSSQSSPSEDGMVLVD